MRTIALVTVGRSDWGIYRPILRGLAAAEGVRVRVLASGMHLSSEFGRTVELVEADAGALGVEVEHIDMLLGADTPQAVGKSMGLGIASFAQSFAARPPDILLVLGDRFEMFTAVAAAVPFVLPVAHIHGGERTAGAIDDALRHAMTKMSHVHFVSTREYGRRVRQLGEDAWRVIVSGAPALDELMRIGPRDPFDTSRTVGFDVARDFVLASFHPTTLEPGAAREQGEALLGALATVGMPTLFMMPNADPGGRVLREMIRERCAKNSAWHAVENLAFDVYVDVLRRAAVLVGNSSSGIIEAPSLRVPVVNVGTRQEGRVRAGNVIDVPCVEARIVDAVARAMAPSFRASLQGLVNPYGSGRAAATIVDFLRTVPLDRLLVRKGFVDLPAPVRRRNPQDFTLPAHATLREVAACIDRNRTGIAVIVDEGGRLLDTITDGDIRRALLAGVSLDADVASLRGRRSQGPYPEPLHAPLQSSDAQILTMMQERRVRQMPILDEMSQVVDLVTLEDLESSLDRWEIE